MGISALIVFENKFFENKMRKPDGALALRTLTLVHTVVRGRVQRESPLEELFPFFKMNGIPGLFQT